MKLTSFAFAFSLFFHLLLTMGLSYFPHFNHIQVTDAKNDIEFDLLNEPENEKTFVQQTEIPVEQLLKDLKNKADYLSEKTQRVVKEMQAAKSGQSKNVFAPTNKQIKNPSTTTKTDQQNSDSEISENDFQKALLQNANPQQQSSQFGEVVRQDVSIGQITALNTDQYTYYSFFSRVQELIRFRWENIIENALVMSHPLELAQLPRKNIWVTEVEFLLDPQGQLTKTFVLRESGFKKFDSAAVTSFKDARIFPNPPKELIESDGFIHLKYRFHVNYSPAYSLKK